MTKESQLEEIRSWATQNWKIIAGVAAATIITGGLVYTVLGTSSASSPAEQAPSPTSGKKKSKGKKKKSSTKSPSASIDRLNSSS